MATTVEIVDQRAALRTSKYGRGRIAASVLQLTAASAPRQLSLYDELAVAKTLLQDAVEVYESATARIKDACALGLTDPKTLQAMFSTLSGMQPRIQSGLDTVRAIAKTATDIEMSIAIQPDLLAFLAAKIENVISSNIEDDALRGQVEHELLTAFADTTIKSQQSQQHILSPADTVYEIDHSVPDVPCDEASYADRLRSVAKSEEPLPEWKNYSELEQDSE